MFIIFQNTNPTTVRINESIISLLLKLHSQLTGLPDSYNSDDAEACTSQASQEKLFGDGTFYVGKVLRKIAEIDNSCKEYINVSFIVIINTLL